MYVNEQYQLYQLAHHLVTVDQYEIFHINNKEEEVWLEKYESKTSKVIRLIHKGYDWKNHLKTDIARVFQKTKAMKKLLLGKKIEIHNVYISSHTPIDEWEMLKKQIQLNEKNSPKMNVYYLEKDNFNEEIIRLQSNIGVPLKEIKLPIDPLKTKMYVKYYKNELANTLYDQRNKVRNILSFGKPFFTYILLLINLIMFLIVEVNGGSTIENLIEFGAKYNPAIIEGEWWRIISSMFLHVGFLHFFMNMIALYYLGIAVERIYGSWRFLIIYLFGGIGGGLASFAFTINVSAGASGAIFGLFGALLFFGLIHSKIFLQTIGKNLFVLVGINLVFGFLVPQIDNGAHVGGLIAGFLVSGILHLPNSKQIRTQLASLIVYTAIILGLLFIGLQSELNTASHDLFKVEQYNKEGKYKAAIERATESMENPTDLEAYLLFQRSYANIQLDNLDLAIRDLEKGSELDPYLDEAYYNLAIVYREKAELDKALESIKEAYELDPDNSDYIDLYDELKKEAELQ